MSKLANQLGTAAQRYPFVLDAALATALLVAAVIGLTGDVGDIEPRKVDPLGYVIAIAGIVPYYFRRRAPLAVLLIAAVPVLAQIERGYTSGALGAGMFILVYTVAAWCSWRRTVIAAGAVAVLIGLVLMTRPAHLPPAALVTNVVLFVGAFVVGRWAQTRRAHIGWMEERAKLLAERAALLERDRERSARQAVAEERLRIAQELHDVVAHSLGVIAVQAGMGARVIDTRPDAATDALDAIARISRDSLTDIRQMLGALRSNEAGRRPPPRLSDVDGLVGEMSAVGLPVCLRVEGRRNGLPLGVDLTGFRVVQEALTNVLKHAGQAPTHVVVRYAPTAVTVEVANDASVSPAPTGPSGEALRPSGAGHGLVGMRERVTARGGTLHAAPRPNGGFRVTAWLPYGPT